VILPMGKWETEEKDPQQCGIARPRDEGSSLLTAKLLGRLMSRDQEKGKGSQKNTGVKQNRGDKTSAEKES